MATRPDSRPSEVGPDPRGWRGEGAGGAASTDAGAVISSPRGCGRSQSSGSCQTPRRKPLSRLPAPSSSPSITGDAAAPFLFIFFVLLGHLQICSSPFSPPRLSGPPHMCANETAKHGREEEICDLFRTSSPGGHCVGRGAQAVCVTEG